MERALVEDYVTMIRVKAHNILSPLGLTSEDNFRAVTDGKTSIVESHSCFGLPEPFCGSIFDRKKIDEISLKEIFNHRRYSLFERLCILSIKFSGIEPELLSSSKTLFVISSTKGNVECLENPAVGHDSYDLSSSGTRIVDYFGNPNSPLIVSNACISGVCAQIAAVRQLLSGKYSHAVVVGCDVLSKFIVSGFQSFKALDAEPCKPFDSVRKGLNLGEAAGTIVLEKVADSETEDNDIIYLSSSIHNDANHISGPSRNGEGSFRVLNEVTDALLKDDIAFISVHGTATPYNDEMESIAIERAGLNSIPVSALKGFYGHTLGAAGVIETVLSLMAVRCGIVLPTKGFSHPGTSFPVNISSDVRKTDKKTFVKILSGFGGTNAGIAYGMKDAVNKAKLSTARSLPACKLLAEITLEPGKLILNGIPLGTTDLVELYRIYINNYPKFFKMDGLSRLGFIASELLLKDHRDSLIDIDNASLIFFNRKGSYAADCKYQATLNPSEFFPSPANFVYTLPNIVTGEIAIRNKIHGETSFYILDGPNEIQMSQIAESAFLTSTPSCLITGWVEYISDTEYSARLNLFSIIQ